MHLFLPRLVLLPPFYVSAKKRGAPPERRFGSPLSGERKQARGKKRTQRVPPQRRKDALFHLVWGGERMGRRKMFPPGKFLAEVVGDPSFPHALLD